MMAYRGVEDAILALKDQVEEQGAQAKYLNLSPSVALELGACHGDVYHLMEVRIRHDMPPGEALITGEEFP